MCSLLIGSVQSAIWHTFGSSQPFLCVANKLRSSLHTKINSNTSVPGIIRTFSFFSSSHRPTPFCRLLHSTHSLVSLSCLITKQECRKCCRRFSHPGYMTTGRQNFLKICSLCTTQRDKERRKRKKRTPYWYRYQRIRHIVSKYIPQIALHINNSRRVIPIHSTASGRARVMLSRVDILCIIHPGFRGARAR